MVSGITSKPYALSGLSPNTTYDWYVRDDCGGGDQSLWKGPSTFTTACVSLSVPWSESFENISSVGNGIVPECMVEDGDWVTADHPQSFNRQARIGSNYIFTNAGADDWLFSPPIDLTAGTSYDFSFWYITDGLSGWTTVEAKYGTWHTAGDMTMPIGTPVSGPTNQTYMEYRGSFTPATSGTYYMSIHVESTGGPWYITFDDLRCEETPTCVAPISQEVTNISSGAADLDWSGGIASVWDIEWGPTGFTQGSGTMVTGITSKPYTLSGLSPNTTYDWYVRDDCGGGDKSAWMGPNTFTTECLAFTASFSENFDSVTAPDIPDCWRRSYPPFSYAYVAMKTSHNPHSTPNHVRFYNSSNASAILLLITPQLSDLTSQSNQIRFYARHGSSDSTGIIVGTMSDPDDNATFTAFTAVNLTGTYQEYTVLFDTSYTDTNEYIAFKHGLGDTYLSVYLDNFVYEPIPSCPPPTGQTESNITDTSADLNWTSGGASTWDIEWGPSGFTQGSGTMITGITNKPYTLSALTPNTTYDWYVRDDCGGGDESAWTGQSTFTTACVSVSIPWIEGFEGMDTVGEGIIPECMVEDGDWTTGDTVHSLNRFANYGTNYVYTNWSADDWLFSPPLDLTGGTSYDFSFWYITDGYSGWTTVEAKYGTWHTAGDMTNPIGTPVSGPNNTDYMEYRGSFTPATTGTYYMGIHVVSLGAWSCWYMTFDDLVCELTPTCPAPTYQTESNITYNSADLGWTTGGASTWDIEWGPAGFTQGSGTMETGITSNPYTLSGLTPVTSYDWYVRDDCGGGDQSTWRGPHTFTTTLVCPAPTDQTEIYVLDTMARLDWTSGGASWDIEWGPTGFTQGSGTMVTGISSKPYDLSGLSPSTTYDWFVRDDCGGGDQSTWVGSATFTTVCTATTVPYLESFDGPTPPDFPLCLPVENSNNDQYWWETYAHGLSDPNAAYMDGNSFRPTDDWFFTQGLQLTAGVTYEVSFVYAASFLFDPVKLAVDWGSAPAAVSMSGTAIFDNNNIANMDFEAGNGTFSPATSGTYYLGFHCYTATGGSDLYVDDVKVQEQVAATTWSGAVDNDWDTPGNWSDGLPSSGTDVTIPAGLTNYPTLQSGSAMGTLLIESDASGNASILNDNMLFVSGNTTVQRYLTGGVWHDFSASTQNQTLNTVYFNHNPDVWLRTYNEPDNGHTYLTNLSDPLPSGAGFEIWVENGNNVTVNFSGALQTEDIILTTSTTPALSYSGPDPLGYNLMGNPFASPIDLDEGNWTTTHISTSFWVWNPTAGTYYDWNTSSGGSGSLTDGIVPMGQGFFVQATGASPSLTIPVGARVHSSQPYYKFSPADEEGGGLLQMSLRALTDNAYDEMNITFSEIATEELDAYDTRKMFSSNSNTPQIYSVQTGEKLSINGLPLLTNDGYEVKVAYQVGTDGTQRLEADLENLPETDVLLEDFITGNVQILNDDPLYKFEANVDDDPIRFVLHFNPEITNVGSQTEEPDIRVYAYDGSIYIQSHGKAAKEKKQVVIYDLFGRMVLKTTVYPSMLNRIPVNRKDAFLIVKTVSPAGVTTTKLLIK